MQNIVSIPYEGDVCVFEKKDAEEPDYVFLNRVWWILKNRKQLPMKTLVNLSHIWSSVYHLGAAYDAELMKQLDDCVKLFS
jgi:hypothetical protein